MQHFRHSTAMLFAALCLFMASAVSAETVTTCENDSVQVLQCANGVINIQSALYGRADMQTCNESRPASQLNDTMCSLRGVEDFIRSSCDLKTSCEINMNDIRTSDPCPGTYKYLQTTFTCLQAVHLITCENDEAQLICSPGCVIYVYGANYGRRDQTICSEGQLPSVVENRHCSNPTNLVAQSCNELESCTIPATNAIFGDPCYGTYKYLELAYICTYPSTAAS
ncbi:L-rhamnose-binding lectin SML-like isoform X1 [Oryzias latipes]|uniref:L-rhamnose-binding lectin SML-like isoform X1 n=1 Tax=Oryzias latipes TaxID=8090 RepID=UPI0009DA3196|nr:L-rhamnose-binding lectin SML-like isoform X1 [Oryzias latipes]